MAKQVHIPKIGVVQFPDGMDDNAIASAASEAHGRASLLAVMNFVQRDPAFRSMAPSEAYKQLAAVSGILEKYPSLIRAIDVGMASIPNATARGPQGKPQARQSAKGSGTSVGTALPASEPPNTNGDNSTTEE